MDAACALPQKTNTHVSDPVCFLPLLDAPNALPAVAPAGSAVVHAAPPVGAAHAHATAHAVTGACRISQARMFTSFGREMNNKKEVWGGTELSSQRIERSKVNNGELVKVGTVTQ